MAIQLAHAGRKASTHRPWEGRVPLTAADGGWTPVAPSARARDGLVVPHELDTAEIAGIVDDFVAAARRSIRAGFRAIEIHAAHGYLLHEFLSPPSNEREDSYGGSFENRVRLPLAVLAAVRAEVGPDFPLFVRLSCTDYIDGGWTIDDTVRLAAMLKAAGCDLVDCSSGGVAPIRLTEADWVPGTRFGLHAPSATVRPSPPAPSA